MDMKPETTDAEIEASVRGQLLLPERMQFLRIRLESWRGIAAAQDTSEPDGLRESLAPLGVE